MRRTRSDDLSTGMVQILTTECAEGTEENISLLSAAAMNGHHLNVYSLPSEVEERELAGRTAVVIDVLRATSTICQALESGAREVVPFVTIEDALAAAAKVGRSNVVLGGERHGVLIPGFDLGNSPSEYTPAAVGGRLVFITTTNGTRALQHARLAKRVVVASFLNLSSVVESLKNESSVDIVCAGTDGVETSEDILLAGAIVDQLAKTAAHDWIENENAQAAQKNWQELLTAARATGQPMKHLVRQQLDESRGGRNLHEVGNGRDIEVCSQIDFLQIVPRLDVHAWKIVAS